MPAKSKSQQRLFGMVHAYQKGKLKSPPASVKRIASNISEEDASHFAETKHEGLPEKRKSAALQEFGDVTKIGRAAWLAQSQNVRGRRETPSQPPLNAKKAAYQPFLRLPTGLMTMSNTKKTTKIATMSPKAAVTRMADYVQSLGEQIPMGTKAAEAQRNNAACNKLLKLAAVIRSKGNLYAAVDEVYATKSAAYRHQVVDGLASGLLKELKKEAAMGCTSHPSGTLNGNVQTAPTGTRETSPQSQTHTMIH